MNALLYKGNRAADWLAAHRSGDILRISLGLVFLGFGVLKFFPGREPGRGPGHPHDRRAQLRLAGHRTPAPWCLTAVAECFVGITLITGRFLKTGLVVLGFSLVGIMSPLVLFFGDLFPGAPTLEAQYVVKDIVLAAAGLVVAAKALVRSAAEAWEWPRAGLMPGSGAVLRFWRLRRTAGADRFPECCDQLLDLATGPDLCTWSM